MRSFVVSLIIAGLAMAGCRAACKNNLPPADMLMHPGPGVDGPGPGVMRVPARPALPVHDLANQICRARGNDGRLGRSARASSIPNNWSVRAAIASRKGPSTG